MLLQVSIEVEHDQLPRLVESLAQAGYDSPAIAPLRPRAHEAAARGRQTARPQLMLPGDWKVVEERTDETYRWPKELEEYSSFKVYEGRNPTGQIRLARGACDRVNTWGRNRKYFIVFHVTAGFKRPLVEFLEADDYAETGELVAVIRGSDGGRKMYPPDGQLPSEYDDFRIETYRNRIAVPGSWNKLAVVSSETDVQTMLNHALIQGHLRFGITPSSQPTS